jgi:CBS domain containing-hemolysin-like protein
LEESQSDKQGVLFRWLRNKIRPDRRPKEIHQVLDESEQQGLIDHEEGDMIEGIFELKQTVAREIMVPRIHVVAVSRDASIEEVLQTVVASGHSRIPVFSENVDHIVGILNAKDLLPLWLNEEKEFRIEEVIREPFFIPETKRIKDLLRELRGKKSHLAVIVDEYGGTAGIVTIEDIIEEIVGEIRDEHDAEEDVFVPQEDGSVLVNAWANLDDFEEYFGVSLTRGGYDTLGGFVIHLMGKVPARGEEIRYEGLRMVVHGGDQKRVTRVLVSQVHEDDTKSSEPPPEPVP